MRSLECEMGTISAFDRLEEVMCLKSLGKYAKTPAFSNYTTQLICHTQLPHPKHRC